MLEQTTNQFIQTADTCKIHVEYETGAFLNKYMKKVFQNSQRYHFPHFLYQKNDTATVTQNG